MIRAAFALLAVLLVAGVLGTLIARDPGYVLIAWGNLTLETSIWFGLILIAALVLIVRLLTLALELAAGSRSRIVRWRDHRHLRRAGRRSHDAVVAWGRGRFARAHELLGAATAAGAAPLLHRLAAAWAADLAGDAAARDRELELARSVAPDAALPTGLVEARLLLARDEPTAAAELLDSLRAEAPDDPHLLAELRTARLRLEDWRGLTALLPALERAGVDEPERRAALARRVWAERLEAAAADPHADRRTVEGVWNEVPKALRRESAVVRAHAAALLTAGDADAAEEVVRAALRQERDRTLLALYGRIPASDPARQQEHAEVWLRARPADAEALLAAGRIAARNGDHAQARRHLAASAEHATGLQRATALLELARVLAAEQQWQEAGRCLQQAAEDMPELAAVGRDGSSGGADGADESRLG